MDFDLTEDQETFRREVKADANRLACLLSDLGAEPGDRIGLNMDQADRGRGGYLWHAQSWRDLCPARTESADPRQAYTPRDRGFRIKISR